MFCQLGLELMFFGLQMVKSQHHTQKRSFPWSTLSFSRMFGEIAMPRSSMINVPRPLFLCATLPPFISDWYLWVTSSVDYIFQLMLVGLLDERLYVRILNHIQYPSVLEHEYVCEYLLFFLRTWEKSYYKYICEVGIRSIF